MARKQRLVPATIPLASMPADFNHSDASAVQAWAAGKANEGQQKRAFDWILKKACGVPVWAFRADQRETDIALGRQFVGQQIMGLLNVNLSKLEKHEETQHG